MTPVAALALIAAATSLGCHAQATLPAPERARLENASRFTLLKSPASLPPEVLRQCADPNGLLAAPAERWNAIDVMTPGLPTRRLIWAARSEELFVVHYEQGGFVHSHHVALVRIQDKPPQSELLWLAEAPRLSNYAAFVRALNANALRPEAPANR